MRFIQPQSDLEFEEYFLFRWKHLREPLGMPPGSEKDDLEDVSFHLTVKSEEGELIGVGKFRPVSDGIVQIAQVAVSEKQRGQGIGKQIMSFLENQARADGNFKIIVDAREPSLSFYEEIGYTLNKEIKSILPEMRVFEVEKKL